MKESVSRAIDNITRLGDTDVFPFPIENHILFDKKEELQSLIEKMLQGFPTSLQDYSPANVSAQAPVSYTGFRWASQIDPLWNALFLGCVLELAQRIEAARVPVEAKIVHSYRYKWNEESKEVFSLDYNWKTFMQRSVELAPEYQFVISCDISEFYARANHHRLENALKHLNSQNNGPNIIMEFLKNFTNTASFGLPVGGPAARLLSELLLNQVDRLMLANGIVFCRFSDDFHIFCNDKQTAYENLFYLSSTLYETQGLQLQKSKTRIMTSSEFMLTNPLVQIQSDDTPAPARSLMQFSIRFDPYGQHPDEEYERLKDELRRLNIIGMLTAELAKSRIHIALSKKIIAALRFLDRDIQEGAVISLLDNTDLLYPVFSNVLRAIKDVFSDLSDATQKEVVRRILLLIREGSHVVGTDINMSYAIRVLALSFSDETIETMARVYQHSFSPIVKRDIILAMAKLDAWYWLSRLKNHFRTLSDHERRAFLIASYKLRDEGAHWRRFVSPSLSPFEHVVKTWASERMPQDGWSIPL